jgi:hypothetical protein
MKTVMIFDSCGDGPIKFFIFKEDVSHLDGVFINSSEANEDLQTELSDLIYGKDGTDLRKFYKKFPIKTVRAGAKVIIAGFYP